MNIALPRMTAWLLAIGLCACAGQPPKPTTVPAVPAQARPAGESAPADADATLPAPAAVAADDARDAAATATAPAPDTAATATAGEAAPASGGGDDFSALYGTTSASPEAGADAASAANRDAIYDPWEPMNRRIHSFNLVVDRYVAHPLATAYVNVVPHPMRLGVTNFFDNLSSPLTMVNQLLQGRPRDAVQTLGRFVVNTTLGIGGVFDPASDLKMKRRSEDFGQTFGVWGWQRSRYLELPFFGPRTVRDTFGLAGDIPLSPVSHVEDDKLRIGLQGLQLVDTRSQLLSLDSLREGAPDEYALTRDAWMQRRAYQIERDRRLRKPGDEAEEQDRDSTVPGSALPVRFGK